MKKIEGYESDNGRVFKRKADAVADDIRSALDAHGEEVDHNTALLMVMHPNTFIRMLQQMEADGE